MPTTASMSKNLMKLAGDPLTQKAILKVLNDAGAAASDVIQLLAEIDTTVADPALAIITVPRIASQIIDLYNKVADAVNTITGQQTVQPFSLGDQPQPPTSVGQLLGAGSGVTALPTNPLTTSAATTSNQIPFGISTQNGQLTYKYPNGFVTTNVIEKYGTACLGDIITPPSNHIVEAQPGHCYIIGDYTQAENYGAEKGVQKLLHPVLGPIESYINTVNMLPTDVKDSLSNTAMMGCQQLQDKIASIPSTLGQAL